MNAQAAGERPALRARREEASDSDTRSHAAGVLEVVKRMWACKEAFDRATAEFSQVS